MIKVRVIAYDGQYMGDIEVDCKSGPWTDDWQFDKQYEFQEAMNNAARKEGGE